MNGLDTNVVSETMKPEPHTAAQTWLNGQATDACINNVERGRNRLLQQHQAALKTE